MTTSALGMELSSDLPEGSMVIEVIVVAKVLDADGETMLFQSCSEGLRVWDAVGMATGLLDTLRGGLQEAFQADGEDDE